MNKDKKKNMMKKRVRARRNVSGRKGAYEEDNIKRFSENIPSQNQPVSDKLFVKKKNTDSTLSFQHLIKFYTNTLYVYTGYVEVNRPRR